MPKVPTDPAKKTTTAQKREFLPRTAKQQPPTTSAPAEGASLPPNSSNPSPGPPMFIIPGSGYTAGQFPWSTGSVCYSSIPIIFVASELYHSVYGPPASASSSEQPNASEHNTGSTLTPSIPSVTRIPMSINNEGEYINRLNNTGLTFVFTRDTTHSFPADSITFGTNLSNAAILYGDLYRQVIQWESQNGGGSTPLGDSRLQFSNTGVQIPSQSEPMAPGSTDLSGSTSSSISVRFIPLTISSFF